MTLPAGLHEKQAQPEVGKRRCSSPLETRLRSTLMAAGEGEGGGVAVVRKKRVVRVCTVR